MGGRPTRLLASLVAIAVVAVVYGWRLHDSPVYLTPDEVVIGLDAHAIATTGHDLRGRWLPLYFQIDEFRVKGTIWYQPAIMYVTALVLKLAPLTEWAIRLPAVIAGVLDVILIFFVARALHGRVAIAGCAALLLFFTPAHFIHSRFAMDYVFPLPFIFAWLLALVHYDRRRDPRLVFVATLCLGAGFYSYIAALMLMGVYVCLTGLLLWQTRAPWKHYGFAAAGFALPLLAFATWLVTHPDIVAGTFARYEFGNARRLGLMERVQLYWAYFSPSYLFFNGGSQLVFSTRAAGVFPLSMAALLPYGMYRAVRSPTPIGHVLLLGFVTAPLAAILLDEGSAINRALEVVPFSVLLAAGAIDHAWTRPAPRPPRALYLPLGLLTLGLGMGLAGWTLATEGRLGGSAVPLTLAGAAVWVVGITASRVHAWRAVTVLLLVLTAAQFRVFLADYYGDYRARSASWFQGNIRGAIEEIVNGQAPGQPSPVYLSNSIRWVDLYWRFYVLKHGRPDLLEGMTTFDRLDGQAVPKGSFVLISAGTPAADAAAAALVRSGPFTRLRSIEEPDRTTSFVVLQR